MLDELPDGTALLHGQYTIDGFLNSGGFGITYRAKDSLGRLVVIKECFPGDLCRRSGTEVVPRSSANGDELTGMVDQFVKEAHSLAALKHKNIVHVHQVFEENNTAYMAIDFVDGPDLLDLVETQPDRLTPDEIVRMTRRMLPAIKFIHDQGLLHRDISPDNILITDHSEPILIDFGAARNRATGSDRPNAPLKFVKDGYSPQEFYDEDITQGPWSDIYSLAATMYHAVCRVAPIDAQTRATAREKGKPDPYLPLAGRFADYPEGFLEAIDTALALVPADRFQTAGDWLANLAARPIKAETLRVRPKTREPSPNRPKRAAPLAELDEAGVRAGIVTSAPGSGAKKTRIIIGGGVAAVVVIAAAVFGFQATVSPDGPEITATADQPAPVAPPSEVAAGTPDAQAATEIAAATPATAPEPAATAQDVAIPAPDIDGAFPARPTFEFKAEPVTTPDPAAPPENGGRAVASIAAPVSPNQTVAVDVDLIPPVAPQPRPTPSTLSAAQVVASHWDVDMPFEETLVQIRNAHTVGIASVSPDADLTVSGDWIAEGVTIFTLNGETLIPETPVSVHLLNTLSIDPDGYMRATVRYREPETGRIDRGLLAVPVVRQIALADGTQLEARVEDLAWQIRVSESGNTADGGVRPDDVLLRERVTGIEITSHEDLTTAFERLVDRNAASATFDARRGGEIVQVSLPLSRQAAGISQ